jgi:hypothetical protein
MSRVAAVLSSERVVDDDGHGVDVKCDPGGNPITAPHYADAGDDSQPLPGDYVALGDSSGSGCEHVSGFADVRNEGKAQPGEKRIYARDASGAVVVELWLKGDGSLVIDNGSGQVELAKGGDVTINGVIIDASGNVKAPGEVTANATGVPVNLTSHIHGSGTGPTATPTPGS